MPLGPVGSSAGPHGALVAGFGRVPPPPKPGFHTVGTGTGAYLYVPQAKPAQQPMGKPFTVRSPTQPPDPPLGGGHYTKIGNGLWQLIHAVGPNQFAPGPNPSAKAGVDARSALLQPGRQLSGQDLFSAAQAIANAQTQGPITELNQQVGQNNRQAQGAINQVGGFYKQLGQQAGQSVTDEQGIANQLNSQLGTIGSQEQSALQGIGQNATDSLLKYAPQSDSSNSLANPALQALSTEIARQQGFAAQNQGAQRAFGATQGANYGGLAASNLGTFGLAGQAALRGIAQNAQVKNEPLMAKIAALRATKGADLATALGRLRQQEISNNIANVGLGLKQQQVNAAVQNNLANQGLKQSQINATIRGQNLTESTSAANLAEKTRHDQTTEALNAAKQAWAQAHPKGSGGGGGGGAAPGGKGLTPNQIQSRYATTVHLRDLVNGLRANGSTPGQIWRFLTLGGKFSNKNGNFQSPGYPAPIVQAAYDWSVYGYINKTDAANLQKFGFDPSGRIPVR